MREFPIRITPKERIASALRGSILIALGGFVFLRTLDVAFSWERWALGQAQLIERWTFFSTGLAIGAVIVAFGVPLVRPAFGRRARLMIRDEWVTVERTGLLPRPIVIQRHDLRAAVTGDLQAFHDDKGWVLPQLAAARGRPNLALLFHGTVGSRGAVRGMRRWQDGSASYLPLPRRRTSGLLLEVVDPTDAAHELGRWADVADIRADDVRPVKPSEYEWRSTRFRIYGSYVLLVALAALHLANVIADPKPDRCSPMYLFCEPAEGIG